VGNDVGVGVESVDWRIWAVRKQSPETAKAGLNETGVVAYKAVEKDGNKAAVDEGSTMLQWIGIIIQQRVKLKF